jgi:hypothetical protein
MKIVFCTNLETVFAGRFDDDLDKHDRDFQLALLDEAREYACQFMPEGCDEDSSSRFADWHGGRFAEQAAKYGYKQCGLVAYSCDVPRDRAMQICIAYEGVISGAIEQANTEAAMHAAEFEED